MQKNNTVIIWSVVIIVLILVIALWHSGSSTPSDMDATATTTEATTTAAAPVVTGSNTDNTSPIIHSHPTPPPVTPVVTSSASLDGLSLRLTSYDAVTIPSGENYTLSFANGTLSARICNAISGPYTTKDGIITAPRLISTAMACTGPQDVTAAEQIFNKTLAQPATYTYVNNVLTISGSAHTLVFNLFSR